MSVYEDKFYKDRHRKTVISAETILKILQEELPPIKSAVDFGCGVGTWLSVLKNNGTEVIKGMDGDWISENVLEISREEFQESNFEDRINLDFKYDLAVSLEVAEHLSPKAADQFVESLTSASDFILFSAAIPYQEGTHHINLQWQEYWANLFYIKGYAPFDFVRKGIWSNTEIPSYYRQNILLYVKNKRLSDVKTAKPISRSYASVVHPERYLSKMDKMNSVKGSFNLFGKAVRNHLRTLVSGKYFKT